MSNYVITANNIAELGGAQNVAHTMARGLVARGHTVYLVGITPVADPHTYPNGGYTSLTLMPQIWPEKTSTNGDLRSRLRADAVSELQSLLQSLGTANIVATQLWSLEILLDALTGWDPNFPIVGQYHGSFAAAATGRDLRRAQRLAPSCAYFTALSVEDASAFAQAGLTNVVKLGNPNTITAEQFELEVTEVRGDTIDYVGRLSAEKGPDLLLAAWEKLQGSNEIAGLTLRYTGSGPLREELKARSIPHVEFANPVDSAAPLIRQSRLVVVPSRTEGAPLVLAEALALGTPVVVTDVSSGVREMVSGHPRAILVARDSVTALAAGITQGLSLLMDPHPVYPSDSVIFEALEGLFLQV